MAAGDEGQLCSICEMRLDDCTCDWMKPTPASEGE